VASAPSIVISVLIGASNLCILASSALYPSSPSFGSPWKQKHSYLELLITCVHRDIVLATEPFTLLMYPFSLAVAHESKQR
jgi:hypothetical protein